MAATSTLPALIPVDLVERLVGPNGLAMMNDARARFAAFRPLAKLSVRRDQYVAEIAFEEPIGDRREASLLVMLGSAANARP